jgi:SAM-dependent methyltransferase
MHRPRLIFESLSHRDVVDIFLQRSFASLRIPGLGSPAYALWRMGIPHGLLLEGILRRKSVLNAVIDRIHEEYVSIKQYLRGHTVSQLMDIGCGFAFIDVFFFKDYNCRLHLVDIERTAGHYHEFRSNAVGYTSLETAVSFLEDNGVPGTAIRTTNPLQSTLEDENQDLILSLYSCGFHYPIDVYKDFVWRALRPGGKFIFDERKGEGQAGRLTKFTSAEIMPGFDHRSAVRVVATK